MSSGALLRHGGQDPALMVQPLFGRGSRAGKHLDTRAHLISEPFSRHGAYQLPGEPSLSRSMDSLERNITAGLQNYLSLLGVSNTVIPSMALYC